MKSRWNGACLAFMLSMSALAHAQGVASAPAAAQANGTQQLAGVAANDSAANGPVTRAEVRHELVQAERDGQLQTLDKTLYAHH